MNSHVVIVTLFAILFYFTTGLGVARARRESGIEAPTMTGDPRLERAVRIQANTLEWMPIFLPSLWIFALYFPMAAYAADGAAILGLVWIVGRFLYMTGYMADPAKRGPGFMIQALACLALLLGGLVGAFMKLFAGA